MNEWKTNVLRSADIRSREGKTKTYVGVASASVLNTLFVVPRRDSTKRKGYQRNPSSTRVKKLANEIVAKKVDLPTAVLLSVRSPVPEGFVDGSGDTVTMDFSVLGQDDNAMLFVVDGQHRILAMGQAMASLANDPNLRIPFVCMVGSTEDEEMRQFYVVNKNAKSVETDLAFDLMRERAENDPDLKREMVEKGRNWEIEATAVVSRLSDVNVWKDLIRLPNEDKKQTIVPLASFVRSLKPLLSHSAVFQDLGEDQRVQLLDAYWGAINQWYASEANDASLSSRADYSLFKGIGVSVINGVLPFFIERVRSHGSTLFQPESYFDGIAEVFEGLEGANSENEQISGIEFWKAGREGAVGSFTSEGGKRVLIDRIKILLPEIAYE